MRIFTTLTCLMLAVLFTSAAVAAEDEAPKQDRASRRSEMRQKMLEKFDADGDGELSKEERATARESMKEMRAKQGGGEKGRRGGQGRDGKGRGQGGRGGAGNLPEPGKMFDKYDTDGDGQLTREEFTELTKAMREARSGGRGQGRGQGRGRGGPGARDGKRPGGPPADGPRRGAKGKDSEGNSDRPGPPEGRGRRGRGGPDAEGGEGRRQFSPGAMFDRLDKDSDGKVSRDEYLEFAKRFREAAGRRQGGGERGARDGRGGRRGPPGAEGSRRGSRKRPDFEESESEDDKV